MVWKLLAEVWSFFFGQRDVPYPDRCIRGLTAANMVENGNITGAAFDFQKGRDRKDGLLEVSINWEDDDTVISFTLDTKKRGKEELKFGFGAAILPRNKIDMVRKNTASPELLSYERKPKADNRYHGNLLLKPNIGKSTLNQRNMAATLAVFSHYVPHPHSHAAT